MAINNTVDDYQQLNDAGTQGDWTGGTAGDTVNFDAPQLNDSAATTPIYVEGVSCMFFPLKSGQTGYTYTNSIPATVDITGKIVVGLLNYPLADISAIPITAIGLRISSNTAFTTNHIEWNALAQIPAPFNVPISGHVPIMGYESGGTVTGTPSKTAMQSIGWTATSGATADGKQGGFDHFFAISHVGAHSQTFTNTFLSDLYDEWYDNNGGGLPGTTDRPVPVLSESGTFYQSNVRFAMGDGAADTANIVVSETGKTIFFNNLELDHSLGWTINNPSSTNQAQLTLNSVVMFWNDQDSTTSIYEGVANADIFRIDSASHANGGKTILAPHISDANTYMRNSSWTTCQRIEPDTMLFTGNTISDTADTGVASGALEIDSTSHRVSDCIFNKGTAASHAIVDTISGTHALTLNGIVLNSYDVGVAGTNVANTGVGITGSEAIHVTSTTGTVTLNVGAGSTIPSVSSAGAQVDVSVSYDLTLENINSGVAVTIVNSSTRVELQHNVSTGADIVYTHSGGEIVDILLNSLTYDPNASDVYDLTLPNADSTINFALSDDPNYENPA